MDCCDHEALHWAASTGGFDSDTVQDVMLGAVERRFGHHLPSVPLEWLTDNGSAYRAHDTRRFARLLRLEPKGTPVCSPKSNGLAESFVKTMKRDYISVMPCPDARTAVQNLAMSFEHYNEWHPRLLFAAGISATPAGLNKRVDESGVIGANSLTERTDHLDDLAEIITICPSWTIIEKKRKTLISDLNALPLDAPRILLAVGKLVGEGVDHPPLDSQILAMPVS